MIISHQHRFVFLKTRKTAGTSIEIALSQHCGPTDVITPVSESDEQLRKEHGGRGPQNHGEAYNHMSARRVRRMFGDEVWDSYYRFVVDRDPWDVMVSAYNYHRRLGMGEPAPGLSEFVHGELGEKFARNSRMYRLGGEVAVHKVCRYEQLAEDLGEICDRLGLPPLELPRAKAGSSKHATRDDLTPDDVERIA